MKKKNEDAAFQFIDECGNGICTKDEFIWCEDLAKINFKPQKNERSGK